MTRNKNKIICLMGPTAAGKTSLAIELAQRLPCDIISVDSAMIYRGMDIGTAKPTTTELQITPHYLIDICDPKEMYSVAQFREDALKKIEEIFSQGRIPVLVGGTMMYFRILQQGISKLPKADPGIRATIKAKMDRFGLAALYRQLQKIDPKTAANIHPTDQQRIQRALEIYAITGKSLSELKLAFPPAALPYPTINIAVAPSSRSNLRDKIKLRFAKMLQLGLIEEVQRLYQRGDLFPALPSIRTVGYRQVWQYLSGEISYEKMLESVLVATNHLAKRQLTWLRSWQAIAWFDSDENQLGSKVSNLMK